MTRDRLLGAARADLVALPALVEERDRLVADRTNHDVSGYQRKVVGSTRAGLSIPVVHLVDTTPQTRLGRRRPPLPEHRRPLRHHPHPRTVDPGTLRRARTRTARADRAGHRPQRVRRARRVLDLHQPSSSGRSSWPSDVTRLTGQVRASSASEPEPEYACAQCGNRAYLQPGGILACTEQPDHDLVVRDLEQQMRRRPALPTKDICARVRRRSRHAPGLETPTQDHAQHPTAAGSPGTCSACSTPTSPKRSPPGTKRRHDVLALQALGVSIPL